MERSGVASICHPHCVYLFWGVTKPRTQHRQFVRVFLQGLKTVNCHNKPSKLTMVKRKSPLDEEPVLAPARRRSARLQDAPAATAAAINPKAGGGKPKPSTKKSTAKRIPENVIPSGLPQRASVTALRPFPPSKVSPLSSSTPPLASR